MKKHLVRTREHIVYTVEPPGDYLCHSEVTSGTGINLAKDFTDVVAEHNAEESLVAVACDGTNVNTGWKDGFIGHVERFLRAILLWLVFQVSKYIL